MKCNRDCFNCPFPDCVEDTLDAEDYRLARQIEREVILPKTKREKEIAAKQRAYYEANREEIAAKQRAYREANREKYNAYMRGYLRNRRKKNAEDKAG